MPDSDASLGDALDGIFEAVHSGDASSRPRSIGPYKVVRRLGEGGMGTVFLAEEQTSKRKVAVKLLHPSIRASEQATKRFQREVSILKGQYHDNVVSLLSCGTHEGSLFYAMEYVEGVTLAQLIGTVRGTLKQKAIPLQTLTAEGFLAPLGPTGDLNERLQGGPLAGLAPGSPYYLAAVRIARQVAGALIHLHRQRVTHRDVKPANIMLTRNGRAILMDFGISSATSMTQLTQSGQFLGTTRYCPPERFEGKTSELGDIYSLGATLYELVCLQPVFQGKTPEEERRLVQEECPEPPRQLCPSIPRELSTVIAVSMSKDPKDRWYQSARAFLADLEAVEEGRPIQARPPSLGRRLQLFYKRKRAAVLTGASTAIALAVLAAAALVLYGWGSRARLKERTDKNLDRARVLLTMAGSSQGVDEGFHEDAVTELVRLRCPGLVRLLLKPGHLDSDNLMVRHLAIEALGKLGDIETPGADGNDPVEAFVQRLSSIDTDRDQETAVRIVEALGRFKDPRAYSVVRGLRRQSGMESLFYQRTERSFRQIPIPPSYGDGGPDEPQAAAEFIERALEQRRRKRYDLAFSDARRAVELGPSSEEAHVALAETYVHAGDAKEAVSVCDVALARGVAGARLHVARGNANMILKVYDEAADDFTHAISLDPNLASAYVNRGIAHNLTRRHVEAVGDFTEALRIAPADLRARLNRGYAYWRLKEYDLALADLNEVVRRDPKNAEGYRFRGMVYLARHKRKEAISDLVKSLELKPSDGKTQMTLGMLYMADRQHQKAIRMLDAAAVQFPHNSVLFARRGIALVRLGRLDEAMKDFDRSLRINPQQERALLNRGRLRLVTGDPSGAVADLQGAAALLPTDAELHFDLTRAYGRRSRIRETTSERAADIRHALDMLKRAIDLGFSKWANITGNADLEAIRGNPRYGELTKGR